ncbi:MAG: TetR family transcriptional regulator [Mycobacteriaceae bacterium]|nr:TetR family transcriptional regulator [Mycobacteriaceae bacterium]
MHLHKADVVDAATALLDAYGIADLTMRRLARELDVSPGALYWHFPSKQALLGAVADRILQPARGRAVPAGWRDRVSGIGAVLRDALLSHTDGAELVSASFAAGQSALMAEVVAGLAAAAAEAGVAGEQAELAARTVVYYVLGFTADEQSRLQWDSAGALGKDGESVLMGETTAQFAFGLDLLIEGMARTATIS